MPFSRRSTGKSSANVGLCAYFDFKADILKKLSTVINRTQENNKRILGLSEFDMNSF